MAKRACAKRVDRSGQRHPFGCDRVPDRCSVRISRQRRVTPEERVRSMLLDVPLERAIEFQRIWSAGFEAYPAIKQFHEAVLDLLLDTYQVMKYSKA